MRIKMLAKATAAGPNGVMLPGTVHTVGDDLGKALIAARMAVGLPDLPESVETAMIDDPGETATKPKRRPRRRKVADK